MTTGDFLLGILGSFIASMLHEGWRKHCSHLMKNLIIRLENLIVRVYGSMPVKTALSIVLFVMTLFTLIIPPNKVLAPNSIPAPVSIQTTNEVQVQEGPKEVQKAPIRTSGKSIRNISPKYKDWRETVTELIKTVSEGQAEPIRRRLGKPTNQNKGSKDILLSSDDI